MAIAVGRVVEIIKKASIIKDKKERWYAFNF